MALLILVMISNLTASLLGIHQLLPSLNLIVLEEMFYSALLIGASIWDRGLSTFIANYDTCNSACAWIWFGGRRSVIQRNAEMCFHQAYNSKTGQTSPEVSEAIVGVLKHYGLTDYQARALVNAAPPESARCATEAWAFRLGFHPQIVPTPFAVRTCQSKFCLAVP
jgi:hypothetical protein